jgi:hypothetical protein
MSIDMRGAHSFGLRNLVKTGLREASSLIDILRGQKMHPLGALPREKVELG